MPVLLSVVVPVYAVEDYLTTCLDSITAGLTAGERAQVEIVAVDDASPDRCGALLDAYGGLKVLHLPENGGLGPARNAGLAAAAGDYVWFVDSDDWLPAGSVRAVLAELRAHRPDVLLIDHLRVDEDGVVWPDASSHLLAGEPARERMLGVQHTAWNRIVNREFLIRHGLRFRPGWYEDVSFSHPVLLAAGRIAVLDRVCYHYRIGRPGAITATRSHRHFEAFFQYDTLHAWMAGRDVDPALRIRMFELMIHHLLVVAGNEDRLHPSHRRQFFRQISALYRRHRPAGYQPRGLRLRLVQTRIYPLYALLRVVYRATAGRRRKAGRTSAVPRDVALASPRTPTASLP